MHRNILSNNQQIRGLVVLLVAKAMGQANNSTDCDTGDLIRLSKALREQRKLAEITDMIHVAQLVHQGVISIEQYDPKAENGLQSSKSALEELNLGNKIAILVGDHLLATSCRRLAELRNPSVSL